MSEGSADKRMGIGRVSHRVMKSVGIQLDDIEI